MDYIVIVLLQWNVLMVNLYKDSQGRSLVVNIHTVLTAMIVFMIQKENGMCAAQNKLLVRYTCSQIRMILFD